MTFYVRTNVRATDAMGRPARLGLGYSLREDHEDITCDTCNGAEPQGERCWTPIYGAPCDRCGQRC